MAFAVGAALNIGFVVIEGGYGLISGSMALLADAGHNLGDVAGLLTAWTASVLARRNPTARYTYGLRSSSMLAALINASALLVITGAIAGEAFRRLFSPTPVMGPMVMGVAAVGILVNGLTAALFASGRKGDINVRGAFLHMLSDMLVSVAVVVAGGVIWLTGWGLIDPLLSLGISALIIFASFDLLRESVSMVMQAVPRAIDPQAVKTLLAEWPGVSDLHDLHIWPMSTTETALTCHLVMPKGHPGDAAISSICTALNQRFQIGHATLQIETDQSFACPLAPEHVI